MFWTACRLLFVSGGAWFTIGVVLLSAGMKFVLAALEGNASRWLHQLMQIAGGREEGALLLIVLGLLVGFIKGRFVMVRAVQRMVKKLEQLSDPIPFSKAYGVRDLFLIGGMIGLGIGLRFVPLDVRGFIDVAVGAALMNGAMCYFRSGLALHKKRLSK